MSNLRRFRELNLNERAKCIVTSNIPASGVYYQIQYRDLLNGEEAVSDNAGLMAIKFLISQNVDEIYLAGFDGYSMMRKKIMQVMKWRLLLEKLYLML